MTLSKEQLFAIINIAEELHAISLAAKNGTSMPGTQDPGRSVEQSITELLFLPALAFNKFEDINSKKPTTPPSTIADVRNGYFSGKYNSSEVMDEFSLDPVRKFDYKIDGQTKSLTCAIDTGVLDKAAAGAGQPDEARDLLKKLCATNFMAKSIGAVKYGGPSCMKVLMLLAKLGQVIDDRK